MPSDPIFLDAQKAIAVAIAADYSAGYSGVDLSVAGLVVRGAIPDAPNLPFACIVFLDCIESQGRVMSRYSGNMVFEIYGFIGGDTTSDRNDNAIRLGADMMNALTSDRTLGLSGQTDDLLCNFTALEGDKFGIPHAGIAFISVSVTFQNDSGV